MIWKALHWALVLALLVEFASNAAMVFFVFQPEGVSGPLFQHAREIPFELMVTRRLYGIEAGVALAGLAIYLGVTEILPRKRAAQAKDAAGPRAVE